MKKEIELAEFKGLERISVSSTYQICLKLGNLQMHQIDKITQLIEILEDNGASFINYELEND